jgi:hypothetical protein
MKFNLFIVQDHLTGALDDIVELIRLRMEVQLGLVNFHVMHFRRGPITLFNQGANLTTGLCPGHNFVRISA